jgi:hypothetical protein
MSEAGLGKILPMQDCISIHISLLLFQLGGPQEPPIHINTYLKPLVDDLLDLWEGVSFTHEGSQHVMRAAVTADLPAMRKVTQYLGDVMSVTISARSTMHL